VLVAFGPLGVALDRLTDGLAWPVRAGVITALTLTLLTLLGLPLSYAVGFVRERRWGFSTQSLGGWAADTAKAFVVGTVLAAALMAGFVALARTFPNAWPLAAAGGFSGVVLLLSFLSPVVFEPLFNRFEPLADERLSRRLKALAVEAGVPVRDVLVADASRRTKKENAYVSGLGRTRRVVVDDTLLARATPDELALVIAHELGHRRMRHVLKATVLGLAGGAQLPGQAAGGHDQGGRPQLLPALQLHDLLVVLDVDLADGLELPDVEPEVARVLAHLDGQLAAQDRLEARVVLDQLGVEQLAAQRPPVEEHGAQVHAGRVEARRQAGRAAPHDDHVVALAHVK